MKQILPLLMLLGLAFAIHAAEPSFTAPILLTSCGQSADVLMMKTLLTKDSLTFDYQPQAKPGDLESNRSLIVVVGGSSKGLGAAKVSESEEAARVEALLKAAKDAGIPVIVAHLGGEARRGELSDNFNRLGANAADHLIVVKGGDNDSLFTKIAEEKKILIETAETILAVQPLLHTLYHPSGN